MPGLFTASSPPTLRQRAAETLAFACLVAPWLNPFAPGPSAAAGPLMFAWLCASLALGLAAWRRSEHVAWAWLVAALASAAIGLAQYFGVTGWFGGLANYTEPGTAYANLRQRNQFATLLSIGTLAVLYLAARGWSARWAAAAIALLAVANAASTSRTGLLQLLLIALLALAWAGKARPPARLCAIALAAYGIAAYGLPLAFEAVTGGSAPGLLGRVSGSAGCSSRMVLWSNVLALIGERPWTGWGIGELDYAHFANLYYGPRFCDILDHAHNLPLHVAVELGVPAAVALFALLAWWVWRGRPWRDRAPEHQLAWGVLAVVAVHSFVEYPLWYGPFQLAVVLSVLLLVSPRSFDPVLRRAGRAAAFVLVPLALAYAAWDYHRMSQLYTPPEARDPAYREDTLGQASRSFIFARQVRFAELSITQLTPGNARDYHELALDMLHFSPEPKVIEAVIDSAMLLGDEPVAVWHMARYRAAFPQEYEAWMGRALLGDKGQ